MHKIELLSPAGDNEKLNIAFEYGADAVYMGVPPFSLRKACEDTSYLDCKKPEGKKIYGAINMYFYENDIELLKKEIPRIKKDNFDAFIVSDLGAAKVLRDNIPDVELHLSTQASCMNSYAVREYKSLGFSRIVLAREVSMKDIAKIKNQIPDMEIEVFVHGAMCMAVSGRCILSSALSGRSGNQGACTQPCRWKYRLAIEEETRPGEYMPIYEDGKFTTILSSRDLCMINHLQEMYDAGVDSIKIEGRMKSLYYTAITTRAYRKALECVYETNPKVKQAKTNELKLYAQELENISHREYTTGFFFDKEKYKFAPTSQDYIRNYRFLGIIRESKGDDTFELECKYKIVKDSQIELIGANVYKYITSNFLLFDEKFNEINQANINTKTYIKFINPQVKIESGFIIRQEC